MYIFFYTMKSSIYTIKKHEEDKLIKKKLFIFAWCLGFLPDFFYTMKSSIYTIKKHEE